MHQFGIKSKNKCQPISLLILTLKGFTCNITKTTKRFSINANVTQNMLFDRSADKAVFSCRDIPVRLSIENNLKTVSATF